MTKSLLIEKYEHLSLNLASVQVTGECRTLRVAWTPVFTQDLDYYTQITNEEPENVYKKILLIEKYVPKKLTGFDAEAELTDILSRQLAQEIDREILCNLTNLENEYEDLHKRVLLIERRKRKRRLENEVGKKIYR